MKLMHRAASTALAVTTAALGVAGVPGPAHAHDVTPMAVLCDTAGQTWWSWSSVTKPWQVTHALRVENFTGSPSTKTWSVTKRQVLTASVTVTASAAGSVSAGVLGKLEVETGLELQAIGETTLEVNETTTYTVQPGTGMDGVTVIFAGTVQATGNWTYNKCSSNLTVLKSYGTAKSWTVNTEGGVRCSTTPPSNTLAYRAKQLYC